MRNSAIYIMCPKCGKNGLLTEMQGQYFCANCMFNYTELRDNPAKLDEVLIETIKSKGFGPLFASVLYQRVTLIQSIAANEYIQQLARKNNIELFQKEGIFGKLFAWLFNLAMRKKH